MMHQDLRRFGVEGETEDKHFVRTRPEYERLLTQDMREVGYVPVLDLGPFWSTWYIPEKDKFGFKVSIHGVKVERGTASKIEGVTVDGQIIPRRTQQNKLKQPSLPAT